jgi:hypothetical protein
VTSWNPRSSWRGGRQIEPPDDSPKFHVLVEFASTFGAGRNIPARISDHQGRAWTVTEVVDHWVHPDHRGHREELGFHHADLTAVRYLLEVAGPLPHVQGSGPQRVWLRSYGNGAGWYMRPDESG